MCDGHLVDRWRKSWSGFAIDAVRAHIGLDKKWSIFTRARSQRLRTTMIEINPEFYEYRVGMDLIYLPTPLSHSLVFLCFLSCHAAAYLRVRYRRRLTRIANNTDNFQANKLILPASSPAPFCVLCAHNGELSTMFSRPSSTSSSDHPCPGDGLRVEGTSPGPIEKLVAVFESKLTSVRAHLKLCPSGLGVTERVDNLALGPAQLGGPLKVL